MKMKTKDMLCACLAISCFALSIATLIISWLYAFERKLVAAQYSMTCSLFLLVLSMTAKVLRKSFNPLLDDEHKRKSESDLKWSVAWFLFSLACTVYIAVR